MDPPEALGFDPNSPTGSAGYDPAAAAASSGGHAVAYTISEGGNPSSSFLDSMNFSATYGQSANSSFKYAKAAPSLMGNVLKKFNSVAQTTSSATSAAWRNVHRTTKVLSAGGIESLYKQSFQTYPNEQLKKKFFCSVTTIVGPVAGILFLSDFHAAFCSDNPLSPQLQSGHDNMAKYKILIPLEAISRIRSVAAKVNSSEEYIQISTRDGHEIWFLGFDNCDKALFHLNQSISRYEICAYASPGCTAANIPQHGDPGTATTPDSAAHTVSQFGHLGNAGTSNYQCPIPGYTTSNIPHCGAPGSATTPDNAAINASQFRSPGNAETSNHPYATPGYVEPITAQGGVPETINLQEGDPGNAAASNENPRYAASYISQNEVPGNSSTPSYAEASISLDETTGYTDQSNSEH